MIKRIVGLFNYFTRPKFLFLYALIILSLLLARDPFSTRTLISNLEPYPDTFHYVVPARNFVLGEGFTLSRGFGELGISVPPLYSLTLIPLFALNPDPRMYYLANALFSLASLYIFFLVLKKITKNRWVVGFSLFLFSTSYYFYWYPQWAMAENLLIPLFLGGIYLLFAKATKRNIILAGLLTVSFYATKYSAAPFSLLYAFIYSLKIFLKDKRLGKNVFTYLISIVAFYLPLHLYITSISGANHIKDLLRIVGSVLPKVVGSKVSSGVSVGGEAELFSSIHFINHLPRYIKATLGNGDRFLWDFRPIIPKYLAVLGYAGLIWGLLKKKTRFVAVSLLAILFVQIVFASSFYSFDMRFVYIVLPTLIIGVSFFLDFAKDVFKRTNYKKLFYLGLVALFSFYFLTNAIRIKDQIVLNLKYQETPWTYISVLHLNDHFEEEKEEAPLVISPVPPFYFDYFSNGNYDLLPLSPEQEFRKNRDMIWGSGDYSDLHALYETRLEEGRELYISTYGLGVEGYLHSAFDNLNENFELTEVYNECFDLCKLYKVELTPN